MNYMNRKGFTLIELLATIVVLGIIMGIVFITTGDTFDNTKNKTEDAFISTIKDSLDMYLDSSDAKKEKFNSSSICEIHKTHGMVKVYKNANKLTFQKVIDSEYKPISKDDLVNPANKDIKCSTNAEINIYRDEDYVYYYKVNPSGFGCLTKGETITNLPSGCIG